jgi:hypothetical protein
MLQAAVMEIVRNAIDKDVFKVGRRAFGHCSISLIERSMVSGPGRQAKIRLRLQSVWRSHSHGEE